jgi:hypothetical protein
VVVLGLLASPAVWAGPAGGPMTPADEAKELDAMSKELERFQEAQKD